MTELAKRSQITLLDGGMGRELKRMGAPFRQPEWSALCLMEAPEFIQRAHESFAAAGSDILTTSNYAVVPFHIGDRRFADDGARLTALAGKLAQQVALPYGCKVAGSIPPLFGSYRPELFSAGQAPWLLKKIIDALVPYVDLWLAETVSSVDEAQAIAEALSGSTIPFWISYTLHEGDQSHDEIPRLRSGQSVAEAVQSAIEFGASALLFNCSQPEVMSPAVAIAAEVIRQQQADLQVGVYANAFPTVAENTLANSSLQNIRPELDPAVYLDFARTWSKLGASIIGGCCGIGTEHIKMLHQKLERNR